MNNLYLFLVATATISLSPGINSLNVVQSSIAQGFKSTLSLICGQQLSLITQMCLVAFGLSWLTPDVLRILTFIGAAYIIWIGITILRTLGSILETPTNTRTYNFWRGYIGNAANPKALLFQAAFVPQFLILTESVLTQYLKLGSIMLIIELLVMLCYSLLALRIKPLLLNKKAKYLFDLSCGILFILIGILIPILK